MLDMESIKSFSCFLSPDWFAAIGTILTAFLAFYFGIFGNRQTKLLVAEKENLLDQEAFIFLTQLPDIITSSLDAKTSYGIGKKTTRENISEFEDVILKESIYLSQKKLKEYNYIIKLANDLSQCPTLTLSEKIQKNRKKLFYKIKKEAEKKGKKVSSSIRLKYMQNLWCYESKAYWKKNIYLICDQLPEEIKHTPILVYTETKAKARELASKHFNDDFYLNEGRSKCDILSPRDYELLQKKKTCLSKLICFIYGGKKIKLHSDQPKNFKELGF